MPLAVPMELLEAQLAFLRLMGHHLTLSIHLLWINDSGTPLTY